MTRRAGKTAAAIACLNKELRRTELRQVHLVRHDGYIDIKVPLTHRIVGLSADILRDVTEVHPRHTYE